MYIRPSSIKEPVNCAPFVYRIPALLSAESSPKMGKQRIKNAVGRVRIRKGSVVVLGVLTLQLSELGRSRMVYHIYHPKGQEAEDSYTEIQQTYRRY
jgi:hypothetical protein